MGLLNGEANKRRELEILYNAAKRSEIEIWTSTVSLVEVSRLASESGTHKPYPAENEDTIANLLEQPFVKLVPVDLETGRRARNIIRSTPGMRNIGDAIHLASALRWPVEAMHTYDRADLLRLSGVLRRKDGEPLKICYPDDATDGPLFAETRGNG